MKKTGVFISLLFILCACNQQEEIVNSAFSKTESTDHFYGVKSVTGQTELRGVAQRDKLWNPGTVITVKLLNAPYGMADQIKAYAAEWEQYANITFDFVDSGDALVRIGFDWNNSRWVTWSYTGTDCYDWLTPLCAEKNWVVRN